MVSWSWEPGRLFLPPEFLLSLAKLVRTDTKKVHGVRDPCLQEEREMRTLLLAGLCSSTLLVSTASAETYVRKSDPSGAEMCFKADGEKAALSNCESVEHTYKMFRDPSGSPMCQDESGALASLDACSDSLAKTIEPNLLDSLPDEAAALAAAQFVNAVESDSVKQFTKLLHPRGIHHGRKKIRARAMASVVRTLGVRSFVSMPDGERWNVRASSTWFSVFRGEGGGNTTIAYFELYRGQWRLVQLARVSFKETASR